ncbi:MAG: hypothetical protein QW727_02135 [Candidatus Pacearchaeota archaeon]
MDEKIKNINQKVFYRRAIPFGNSAGILLPRSLLGAYIKASIINPPRNIKKDSTLILAPILEYILGLCLIKDDEKKVELLAISTNIHKHLERGNYIIDIVPFERLKKSIKEKKEVKERIKNAKPIINSKLLADLKKDI